MLGASLFLYIDLHLKVIEANIAHVTVDIAQAAADMVHFSFPSEAFLILN